MHRGKATLGFAFAVLVFVAAMSPAVLAHEGHNKNANTNANAAANSAEQPVANANGNAVPAPLAAVEPEPMSHTDSFPTLHPMVVHFPITLILLAAAFQIASLFVFRREMSWAVIFLAAFGALGAYLSSSMFHPHTSGLSANAQRLLEEHELYADLTLWLSIAGVAAKVISHFVLKRKWWSESVVTVTLILASIAVGIAGHHGAELVHKEGVGPQGKFLESHQHQGS